MKPGQLKRSTAGLKRTPIAACTGGLKRTAMAASSTPMVRTGIKQGAVQLVRTTPMVWKQIDRSTKPMVAMPRRRRLRSRGPKMTPIRSSAEGELCDFNIAGLCDHGTETTVWCHSNLYADGKGMGIKANDEAGCYGCGACHAFYDGGWTNHPGMTRELVEQVFARARAKSRLKLKQKGLVNEY
ncbi:nuclease domain-containing protein [Massilia sp. TSP1-1-2]|uniref:nuclease domain-containing protein n=1 Tax=Massilia sp. TSP1-1-2 TaxID=2804649 RepID=UPI003CF84738